MEKLKINILSLSSKNKNSYFLYLIGQIKYRMKILFYALTRQQFKKNNNIEKLAELKLTKCCKVLRHPAVFKSLIRGLTVLDVPFVFNIKPQTDTNIYIYILIWLDNISDLQRLAKIKEENNIKILAVPTAYQIQEYHSDNYQKIRQRYIDIVDIHLAASQIETNALKHEIPLDKLNVWASGVSLGRKNPILANKKCICYVKAKPLDTALIAEIEKLGIQCSVIHYYQNMNYNYFDWKEKLQKTDFVVILTHCQETQGIAYFEAWAENKPTIHPKGLCPYSSKKTSLEYADMEELFEILKQYAHNPKKFLKQFEPYETIKNKYTDEISVQNLLDIANKNTNS